jgi:Zn-dependent oligopeptidase
VRIAPWDRQFYAEKLRRERFGLDGDAVKSHLPLDAVLVAMFWAAGRVHGLAFARVADAPVVHPSCRVYEVSRAGAPIGCCTSTCSTAPARCTARTRPSTARARPFAARCCRSRR